MDDFDFWDGIREIKKHNPEFIYFSSEMFLGVTNKDFDMFIKEYDKIKLPFWFQTRFETISKERIKKLKDVGMLWLTIGLEHGNEKFRETKNCNKNSQYISRNRTHILFGGQIRKG